MTPKLKPGLKLELELELELKLGVTLNLERDLKPAPAAPFIPKSINCRNRAPFQARAAFVIFDSAEVVFGVET